MSGSLANPLLMALLSGQPGAGGSIGGGIGGSAPGAGMNSAAPLSTLPPSMANLSPDAVALQRGSPQLPWYAVPNIFGPGPAPAGVPGAGPAGSMPGMPPGAQMQPPPQQPQPQPQMQPGNGPGF